MKTPKDRCFSWPLADRHEQGRLRQSVPRPLPTHIGRQIRQNRFFQLLDACPIGVTVARLQDGRIVKANQAYLATFGLAPEQLTGRTLMDTGIWPSAAAWAHILEQLRKGGHADEVVMAMHAPDGQWRHFAIESKVFVFQGERWVLHIYLDITQSWRSQEALAQLAFQDELTKLPNRRLFLDRLGQSMLAAQRHGHHGAVLFLDLDDFKALNDSRGHRAGDLLLIQVGQRIRQALRQQDTVARLGGDEFVVLLPSLHDNAAVAQKQAWLIACKIIESTNRPYRLDNDTCASRLSVGITLFDGRAEPPETVMARADQAMYRAKASRTNQLRFQPMPDALTGSGLGHDQRMPSVGGEGLTI